MHHFIDYKGFSSASIELIRPFTLLIGPNGSGKSNTIEAIELLSFVARGRPLHEIGDIGRSTEGIEIRGGLQACGRIGVDRFTLGFSASIRFEGKPQTVWYYVRICTKPYPQILEEKLIVGDRVFYETLEKLPDSTSRDITVKYDNFKSGVNPQVRASSDRSVLSQYQEIAIKNRKIQACLHLVQIVMSHLQASFVFDPSPRLMHNYERVGDSILKRDGSNLSAVLYGLQNGNEEQQATLQRILERISHLPDEPYVSFDFTLTDLGDVIFGFLESTGYIVDARSISDGTLRTLAILTALETVETHSRVIVEEFDNGLHPSRVGVLTSALIEVAEQRNLQVLVTTHNPATMNHLSHEQLQSVVLCTWDSATESANLVQLDELPRNDALLERGRLGDLVSQRALEKHLAPDFEEEQQKKVLQWLEDLT